MVDTGRGVPGEFFGGGGGGHLEFVVGYLEVIPPPSLKLPLESGSLGGTKQSYTPPPSQFSFIVEELQ